MEAGGDPPRARKRRAAMSTIEFVSALAMGIVTVSGIVFVLDQWSKEKREEEEAYRRRWEYQQDEER